MSAIEPAFHSPSDRKLSAGSRTRAALMFTAMMVAVIALGLAIVAGIKSRLYSGRQLATATAESSIPIVQVVHPQLDGGSQEISLPGNTQAYIDSPIYARTNGYLKSWSCDIGAHLKKGQLLAVIETPEVDQQLGQGRAELETARANVILADLTARRYLALKDSLAVSKEQIDTAVEDLNAKKATVDSNAANVSRLEQLQSFEKVYAPFDGVITARNTDVGALINAGASGSAEALFRLVDDTKLRVYVAVPEIYSAAAQTGATAQLTLDEYPGQTFQGVIVRDASAIDLTSRTLKVEVDVDNSQTKLLTGAYVFVHLKLPEKANCLTVPANTLLFRAEGLQVGVVEGGHARLQPVMLGRDFGKRVEVISGLQANDAVILSPSDSLISGTEVRVN
jgi:RND family efflux transporter MFP subunit